MVLAIEVEAFRNDGLSLSQTAWNLQLTRWMNAAAISLLIYDTFLVLGDEVVLLWPKRWGVIKTFYFSNRALCAIFTLLHTQQFISLRAVSDEFCTYNLLSVGIATFISFAMCNWMLLARTRALIRLERPYVDTALVVYFAVSYIITGVLVILTCIGFRGKIFYSPTIRICAASVHPKTMGLIWISPMLFETTIFVITTIKIHQMTRRRDGHFASHLFSVLFRDGVCYYVSICLFRTWNLVVWNLRPISPAYTGLFILWSIMSVACSRLQLNLLKATSSSGQNTGVSANVSSTVVRHDIATFGHRADGNRWVRRKQPSAFNVAGELESKYDTRLEIPLSPITPSRAISNSIAIAREDKPRHHNARTNETRRKEEIPLVSISSPTSDYQRQSLGGFPDSETGKQFAVH